MTPTQWPGDRQPTQWDASNASEGPAPNILTRFRSSLLRSDEATDSLKYCDHDTAVAINANFAQTLSQTHAYPITLLENTASIPVDDDLLQLIDDAGSLWKNHIFLDRIPLLKHASAFWPPYLKLAAASIAVATSSARLALESTGYKSSAVLFQTGCNMWIVTQELDNCEARSLEALIAVRFTSKRNKPPAFLLITYGMLSNLQQSWSASISIMSYASTISRRLHFTDNYLMRQQSATTSAGDPSSTLMSSALMAYMLIVDCVQALHRGLSPIYSIKELSVKMPCSRHQFRTLYNSLLHGYPIPKDVATREDAMLLLTALLNDSYSIVLLYDASDDSRLRMQSASTMRLSMQPFTLRAEYMRLSNGMILALDRWQQHFHNEIGDDIIVLYYFCKLLLICPDSIRLPRHVGYRASTYAVSIPRSASEAGNDALNITDDAVDLAWAVLDRYEARPDRPEHLSIWLPIVFFITGLVVWYRLQAHNKSGSCNTYRTLKVLKVFVIELQALPWECAKDMAKTFERLISK